MADDNKSQKPVDVARENMEIGPPDARSSIVRVSERPDIGATVEELTKIAALFGIVSYAIGLLTTNVYLLSVGTTDFSPLRVRFLYSGVAAVLSIGLPEVFLLRAVFGFLAKSDKELSALREKGVFTRLAWNLLKLSLKDRAVVATLVVAFVACLYVQVTQHSGYPLYLMLLASAGVLLLIILVPILGVLTVWSVADWREDIGNQSTALRTSGLLTLGFGFFMCLLYLFVWYGEVVLPAIPEQFGGTRPRWVSLVVTDGSLFTKMGLQVKPGTSQTVEVKLLYESDEWITLSFVPVGMTVGGGPDRHVSIARQSVTAMIVKPEAEQGPIHSVIESAYLTLRLFFHRVFSGRIGHT